MTKKIILIEFDYHPEVLRNTIEILNESCLEVSIFTTVEIWHKVGFKKENIPSNFKVFPCINKDIKKHLKNHLQKINSADCILYNTAASRFNTYLGLDFKPKQIMRVHNANANFNDLKRSYSPIFTPFFMWKDTSHLLRKFIVEVDHHRMKKFIKQMDAFAFASDELRNYALRTFKLKEDECITLPLVYTSYKTMRTDQQKQKSRKIVLTVIGKIDPRNRNYKEIIKSFELVAQEAKLLKRSVELVFLGSAKTKFGKDIIKQVSQLSNEYATLKFFDDFVNEKDFQMEIERTDFFIIPTHKKTRYTIYTEWYGKTKISGAINDVIKYQKPAFISSHYPIDKSLSNVLIPYSNAMDLANHIKNMMNDNKPSVDFNELNIKYSLSEIRKQYENALLKVIENA